MPTEILLIWQHSIRGVRTMEISGSQENRDD